MKPRSRLLLAAFLSPALASACHETSGDGPPAEEKLDIASAAPGAVGALAGGTDAAPPPPARAPRKTWHVPSDDDEEEAEPEEIDAGPSDGGVSAPSEPEVPL